METSQTDTTPKADHEAAARQAKQIVDIIMARPAYLFERNGHLLPGNYSDLLDLLREDFTEGLTLLSNTLLRESGDDYVVREVSGVLLRDQLQTAIGTTRVDNAPEASDVLTAVPTIMLLITEDGFIPTRGADNNVAARMQTTTRLAEVQPYWRGINDDMLDYMAKLILDEAAPHTRETIDNALVGGSLPQFMAACDMIGINFLDLFIEAYKNTVVEDD